MISLRSDSLAKCFKLLDRGFNCLCFKWKIVQLKPIAGCAYTNSICLRVKNERNQSDANKWMYFSVLKQNVLAFVFLLHCFANSLSKRINISLQPIEYSVLFIKVETNNKVDEKKKVLIDSERRAYTLNPQFTKFSIPFSIFPHNNEKKNIPQI